MMPKLIVKWPVIAILAFALLFAKLHNNKRANEGKDVCFNISDDARGYYAWLPAIFIYHDLNFSFFDSVETKDTMCGRKNIQDYRNYFYGRACNKYYPGSAFLMIPFFAVAHLYTVYFTSLPPNGYSFWYFKLMPFAAIFYYVVGMLFFLAVLRKLMPGDRLVLATVFLVTFGSNLIYYVIDAPLYSHIYSFALIAAFLYFAFALSEQFSPKYFLSLSFIAGLIFVTRPVNLTILLMLPFIHGEQLKVIRHKVLERPLNILYCLPSLVAPSALFILYRLSTGHFFIYSYQNEGFDLLHPHFVPFLFSYDNGILPYTPLLVMPLIFAYAWLMRQNKALFTGYVLTMVITIYIQSSWWCWYYGFSFGARTMVEFIPVFGILIGLSLKQTNLRKHFYILPVYFLCCAFTLILYHQKSAGHMMNDYPITDYWKALRNATEIR